MTELTLLVVLATTSTLPSWMTAATSILLSWMTATTSDLPINERNKKPILFSEDGFPAG